MEYEQLQRCYKNIMSQRDRYHDLLVDAEVRINELEDKLQFLVNNCSINDHSIQKEVENLLLK